MSVEEGVVHHRVPVGVGGAVEQQFDGVVAFAVERGEEEDEYAQHGASQGEFLVGVLELAEEAFDGVHGAGEVERYQSAEDAQHDDVGDAFHLEGLVEVEFEQGFRARGDVGDGGGGDG